MFKNKKIFVLGMGKSGVSVARLLAKENHVLITDIKCDDLELIKELEGLGVNVIITKKQNEIFDDSYDYVVKNPGVKLDHPVVLMAKKFNIPILTELEVAYRYLPDVKIIGITGSNGKTTTTTIIYGFLKAAGIPVHLAGNIGYPLCSQIDDIKKGDVIVAEISSHQLVNLDKFKVDVAVLTNLYPVHLDFFGTYEKYKMNKLRIFNNQDEKCVAILNKGDENVYELTKNLKAKKEYFSSKDEADICIDEKNIVYHCCGCCHGRLCSRQERSAADPCREFRYSSGRQAGGTLHSQERGSHHAGNQFRRKGRKSLGSGQGRQLCRCRARL